MLSPPCLGVLKSGQLPSHWQTFEIHDCKSVYGTKNELLISLLRLSEFFGRVKISEDKNYFYILADCSFSLLEVF